MYKLRIENTDTDLAIHKDCATLASLSLAYIQAVAQCMLEDDAYVVYAFNRDREVLWEASNHSVNR